MAGGSSPCASCKLLRRRCAKDCIFAPYFPPDDPHKFAIVHKVFGASNVSKMLQELPLHQRADAVSSLVYEANARMRDPVYGCVGAISYLQNQVSQLQMQLAVAQAEILCIEMQQQDQHHHHHPPPAMMLPPPSISSSSFHEDIIDQKSNFLLASSSSNFNNLQQYYLNYTGGTLANSSSSTSHVMQDPLKRESLWT